jgi:hypothetical protein
METEMHQKASAHRCYAFDSRVRNVFSDAVTPKNGFVSQNRIPKRQPSLTQS